MTKPFSLRWLFALALLALIASLTAMPQLFAKDTKAGALLIENPWARATPKGASVGAGYLRITNIGKKADTLLGISTSIAKAQIHEMTMKGDVMEMRALAASGLEIKPGATVELKPNGMHVMFMSLKNPLKPGDEIKATLKFAQAGDVPVLFIVAPVNASGAPQHTH